MRIVRPKGTSRQRSRRKQGLQGPVGEGGPIAQPGPRGPVGRRGRPRATPRIRFQAPTKTTSSLEGVAKVLGDTSPLPGGGPTISEILSGNEPATDALKEDLETILDVQKRRLGGRGELSPLGNKPPSLKEVQAAADVVGVAAPASGAIARGAKGALRASELAAKAATGVKWGRPVSSVLGKVARRVEPAGVRVARQSVTRRGARAASRLPQGVKTGGKIAARGATLPARRPFTTPIAAQVPAAATSGDPSKLGDAFTGQGAYATIANELSKQSPVAIGEEALNLPAVILPSTYAIASAGVKAAGGERGDLDNLVAEWRKVGLLPALAEGDGEKALSALGTHPLYSGLEASGALSALGRGAGAAARVATRGRVGGQARPDLTVPGYDGVRQSRRYSPDLIRQTVQRALDKRSGNEIDLSSRLGRARFSRLAREAGDRFQSSAESTRRLHAAEVEKAVGEALPKKRLGRLDKATAHVVDLAVQRIAQTQSSFVGDLGKYRTMLEEAFRSGKLDKVERKANRELVKNIDLFTKKGDVDAAIRAADEFIELQAGVLDQLVKEGLIERSRAETAAVFPWARIHRGAEYKEGVGLVDKAGNRLSVEQIAREMKEAGVNPPGFLSHRRPSSGDFYAPGFPAPKAGVPKTARTGTAVLQGSQLGGVEALIRQVRRDQGLLDRVKSWNKFVDRGVEVKGVKDFGEARKVREDPARYGLPEGIDWVPVRRFPFGATKKEIANALEHQDPGTAASSEGFLEAALRAATDENGAPGSIVFLPRQFVDQVAGHFRPSSVGGKRFEAAATAFKRAVLPFSPSFYYGNAIDNAMRTVLAGINPAHFFIGRAVLNRLSKEEAEQLVSGAHYGSVARTQAYRSSEQLFPGDALYEQAGRAIAEAARKPGVRTIPRAVSKISNYLLKVNSQITERFPQYGAVGKLALAEFKDAQGSWIKGVRDMDALAKHLEGKVKDPAALTRLQKDIERTYGNWVHMSPNARKVLSRVAPFWTWMRAASTFVFATLPAHHPIQTALLTAGARMTEAERQELGLDKLGEEPLPSWLQGSLPIGDTLVPTAKYTSFGFAGEELENAPKAVLPQYRSALEALQGRDWKGEPIGDRDSERVGAALLALVSGFTPGAGTIQNVAKRGPSALSPVRSYPQELGDYLKRPTQTIKVPESGGTGSSSGWGRPSGGGSTSSSSSGWGRP